MNEESSALPQICHMAEAKPFTISGSQFSMDTVRGCCPRSLLLLTLDSKQHIILFSSKKPSISSYPQSWLIAKYEKTYQTIIILLASSNLFISALFLIQLLHSSPLWKAAFVKLLQRFLLAQFLVQIEFRILILLFISLQIIGELGHYILWEASFSHLVFLWFFHLILFGTQEVSLVIPPPNNTLVLCGYNLESLIKFRTLRRLKLYSLTIIILTFGGT